MIDEKLMAGSGFGKECRRDSGFGQKSRRDAGFRILVDPPPPPLPQGSAVKRSLVSKIYKSPFWSINLDTTSDITRKDHLKMYKQLYAELLRVFTDARKKAHRVHFNWIWSKARQIQRGQTDNPDATIGRHVI